MLFITLLIAQAAPEYEQTEYGIAIALAVAMVVLGLVALCVPRTRKKHFVEPEEQEAKTRKGGRKTR